MVNFVTRACIGILIVFIASCGTTSSPDWVEGKSQHYITKTYILGRGIGQTITDAKESAAKQITLQFKDITASGELSSQANIIFNQIEYEKPWVNINTDLTHVLAYISRDKVATLIQNKMLALDELTYQFFEQAKSTTDLLEQTSYIDSAINAQTRRMKLKPVLHIINSNSDIPSSYNVARLSKVRDQLQVRINLHVDIVKDNLGELDSIIKKSLDSAGFVRNEKVTSKNHLLVELKLEESKIPDSSGALLMQGVLITALQSKDDESARGQHKWTFNVTADNRDSLIKKSREIITTQLDKDLKRVLMGMMVIEYDNPDDVPNQDYRDFDMPEFNHPENKVAEQDSEKKTDITDKTKKSTDTEKPVKDNSTPAAVVAPTAIDNNQTPDNKSDKSSEQSQEKLDAQKTPEAESKSTSTDTTKSASEKPLANGVPESAPITDFDDSISLPPLATDK